MQGSQACGEGRPLRPVHLMQQLSEVQVHQAQDRWCSLPKVRMRRRIDRAALQTWEGVLRLLQLSGWRFRSLEQAHTRAVSVLRRVLARREDDQERRNHTLLQRRD